MMRINLQSEPRRPTFPITRPYERIEAEPVRRRARLELDLFYRGSFQGTAFQTFSTIEAVVEWARRFRVALILTVLMLTACGAPKLTACEGVLPVTCTDVERCAVNDGGVSFTCEVEPCVPYCWRRDR